MTGPDLVREGTWMGTTPSYLFAGDRAIAVQALRRLVEDHGHVPRILCVSDRATASHADELVATYQELGGRHVLIGSELRTERGLARLRAAELDFALSVHFPDLVRTPALEAPRMGWLNLHPAYLPFNRGWHTPTWAILDGTPAGATLHVMVEEVDAGPIVARRLVPVMPSDTADSLYQRLLAVEVELLCDVWPRVAAGDWELQPNVKGEGSAHRAADLFHDDVQRIDRDELATAGRLIDRLRALTTNDVSEAAWFEQDGVRYRMRLEIVAEVPDVIDLTDAEAREAAAFRTGGRVPPVAVPEERVVKR